MSEARIGVFVCYCGTNIGGVIDVPALVEYAAGLPSVVHSEANLYTCSDAGLTQMEQAINDHKLNRVVVAACTPRTHEPLFRKACEEAGLNPYLLEFVNIREQCSWVHMDEKEKANAKARDLLRMSVARATLLSPQQEASVPVHPLALVIGGGIAGMTAALSLANRGLEVVLVEREEELGGTLRNLHRLHPDNVDALDFISSRVDELRRNPKITVATSSTVKSVSGFIGNYNVVIDRRGSGGDPSAQTVKAGVIIVATGSDVFRPDGLYNYDGETVITQLELEDLLRRKEFAADRVTMIQCVGARNDVRTYCSRICCITAIKNAMLLKEASPASQIFILYRDIQTHGTSHEEQYNKAREAGVIFVKYSLERPPVVSNGQVTVYDEMLGQDLSIDCDLVVLSTPLIAHEGSRNLSQTLRVPLDENGFFLEAHAKLRPVEFANEGIYLCGCTRWPADVSEAICQAEAAAAKASIPLSQGQVRVEPIIAAVDEEECSGCGLCESICPFNAIQVEMTRERNIARVVAASCKGCGVCGAICPWKAISMQHFSDKQLLAQIDALVETAR